MEPFIGEIIMFGGNFAPRGWALCDGQLLPISQNQALFSILGTTYGGDGRTSFGLPDLRGRVPVHPGQGPGLSHRRLGEKSGREQHTLSVAELPSHNHAVVPKCASLPGNEVSPEGNYPAPPGPINFDTDMDFGATATGDMGALASDAAGGSQSFDMMPPYGCINYIIALVGVYPSRT